MTHGGRSSATLRRHLLLLALVAGGACALRIVLPWQSVFGDTYVSFVESDAWYHMRLVDALVQNFPWRLWYDPYLAHPGGEPVNAGPVFDWLIAGAALLLGRGSPSEWLVDVVGAFTPPVIGALTTLPVYVLGRELWSSRAGLWAAFIMAVVPGQLLDRSMLGFTDHHCLETLLSTVVMMCVIVALKRDAASARRWALGAGFAFGAYLLTWGGAVLFVGFIVAWAGLQVLADAVRGVDSDDVTRIIAPMLLVAALMVAPWSRTRPYFAYQFAALVGGTAGIWALVAIQRVGRQRGWPPLRWIVTIASVAIASGLLALVVLGDHAAGLLADAARVSPFRRSGFVSEAQPLIGSRHWYPVPLWHEFTSSVLLAAIGLGLVLREFATGAREPRYGLLGLWTATMTVATFGQVRFTYYLGINVALLAGFACARLLAVVDRDRPRAVLQGMAVGLLAAAIALPGVPSMLQKRVATPSLHASWHDALTWLRVSTPEPLGDAEAYLRRDPEARSSYGVMAWWDYGYWITRVARRVPISNPRQTGVNHATDALLAQTPADASRVMDRVGARYVIVDWQLQAGDGAKEVGYFGGMVVAARGNPLDYCGYYAVRDPVTKALGPKSTYCYPAYYRTMAMRLYIYGGHAATPPGLVSVVAANRLGTPTGVVHEITNEWTYGTYEEAEAFVKMSGRKDLHIVSKSLRETCVPLEEVQGYRQVFRSLEQQGDDGPAAVQVFEYTPARPGA